MLTVTIPADSHDLTTLDAVKRELGLTDAAQDAHLTALISQASDAIARHCDRVFAREDVLEIIQLTAPQAHLVLERRPVVQLASIREDGRLLDGDAYRYAPATGVIGRETALGPSEWRGRVEVAYTAGWAVPGGAGARDLPYDVERAAVELVKTWWFGRTRDPRLEEDGVDGVYRARLSAHAGLPPVIASILSPYRVRRV